MAKDFTYVIRSFGGLADRGTNGVLKETESPDMVNFLITADRRLQKRPGFRTVKQFDGEIRAIRSVLFSNMRHYFVVECVRVWHSVEGFEQMEQIGTLPGHDPVRPVEFDGKLLFLSGSGIRAFDPEKGFGEVEPYRPLLTVATTPAGVGTPLEDVNLLGGRARQSFSPDGEAQTFFLAFPSVDSVDYVTLNGASLTPGVDYVADPQQGCVTLNEAPLGHNPDSLEIGFTKRNPEGEDRILRCRWGMAYGGDNDLSLFLWGNPDCPALRFHSGSAQGNPCAGYFPELNYTRVGEGAPITDIVRHYDRQVIFTKDGAYDSYPQSVTDALGRERIRYPVYLLSSAAGNLAYGNASCVENDPVSVTPEGLCRWSSTEVREEKNARVFSRRIRAALERTELSQLKLYRRPSDGCLYLVTEEKEVYVYSPSLDLFWHYRGWEPFCFFEEEDSTLYFGTADGRLCRVGGSDDDGEGIVAYWRSAWLSPGDEIHTKHLHRVGLRMGAEPKNRITLSWTADVEGTNRCEEGSVVLTSRVPLFSFETADFSDFGFHTADHSGHLSARARARRFSRICFTLRSEGTEEASVERLTLTGTVNDKKEKGEHK